MPRRAVKAFRPPVRSQTATATNREGYPAWERPLKEQYLQTLLTNTFGNSYYAKASDLIAESEIVHTAMLAEDGLFAQKALVYAREKGYMRTQPIYGLARLFKEHPNFAAAIFDRIIRTPNDLADFTAIVKTLRKGEGGRAIKRAAGKWLLSKLGEYQVIKYGAEKGEGGYSLKDMLQVYHPKAGKRLPLFDYIMGGVQRANIHHELGPESLPQINNFELLKLAKDDADKVRYITDGGLPHEVATSFAGTSKKVWEAIVPNLPIFALLRNLATLERHGVANSQRKIIESKLLDPQTIQKSMILPFRFVEAIKHVKENWLADAVRGALDLAVANVPDVPGLTDVALDISGSMQNYLQTAAVFGICLARKSGLTGKLWVFNTDLGQVQVSARDSILSQAELLRADGGTDHTQVVSHLLAERRKLDNLIYITDEQQNTGMPLIDLIDEYRRRVNSNLKLFIVDVGPYRDAITPNDKNTWYVYGWSDQALSFISMAAHGFGSMIEQIEKGMERP
jgi:60 kDa SS-A/Ro ribonucleoprotein